MFLIPNFCLNHRKNSNIFKYFHNKNIQHFNFYKYKISRIDIDPSIAVKVSIPSPAQHRNMKFSHVPFARIFKVAINWKLNRFLNFVVGGWKNTSPPTSTKGIVIVARFLQFAQFLRLTQKFSRFAAGARNGKECCATTTRRSKKAGTRDTRRVNKKTLYKLRKLIWHRGVKQNNNFN